MMGCKKLLIIILLASTICYSQDKLCLQTITCKPVIETNFSLENNLYLLGASATFITFDYIGYNSWGQYYENQQINPYRVVQVIVQAGITYGLAKLTKGWQVPVAFNFIWITGGMDYGYYGLSEITNGFGLKNWEGRGTYAKSSLSHMDWTLVGWFYPQSQPIPKEVYEWQAGIGAVIGFMGINIKFNF